jgi:Telomerase ribonucleoprotein complex - RNA binding domain
VHFREQSLLDNSELGSAHGSLQGNSTPVKVGRSRAPSWKRRKARKVKAAQEVVASSADHAQQCRSVHTKPAPRRCRIRPRLKSLVVPRQAMFFCPAFPCRPGFASRHPLSALPVGTESAHWLMASIWGPDAPQAAHQLHRPGSFDTASGSRQGHSLPQIRLEPGQQQHIEALLKQMLRNAAQVPWSALLEAHCGMASCLPSKLRRSRQTSFASDAVKLQPPCKRQCTGQSSPCAREGRCKSAQHMKGAMSDCLPNACRLSAVCGFVRAVLRRLVPRKLLGVNARTLQLRAMKLLCMRRHEKLTLHDIMQGMRTKGLHWLDVLCASPHLA